MAKVFAIANQKGGVGKTTTCINLAASLVATKRRVLLIDLDPQGNATMGSGVDKHALEHSVYDLLIGECDLSQAMHFSEHGGYQLLPANRDLTAAEVVLLEMQMKESRLRSALAPIRENYDYILIDCPPSLSMLTLNALVAADGVIIPMQCEYFALEGLSDLVDNIKRIGELLNPQLKIEGLLRTMYEPRLSLINDESAQLKEHFGEQLLNTRLVPNPDTVRLRVYQTNSVHKSMSALRQGSVVLVRDVDYADVEAQFHEAVFTHASTSPNLQIIATLDVARRQMELEGYGLVSNSLQVALEIRRQVNSHPLISKYFKILTNAEMIPAEYRISGLDDFNDNQVTWTDAVKAVRDDEFLLDPTRMTLTCGGAGFDGTAFKNMLADKFNIQVNKTSRTALTASVHVT